MRPFAADQGRSGRRLAELMGVDDVSDVAVVINLLGRWPGRAGSKGDRFPMTAARVAARRVTLRYWQRVFLVRRRVAEAFGVRGSYLV
jgi:hypothetical protein